MRELNYSIFLLLLSLCALRGYSQNDHIESHIDMISKMSVERGDEYIDSIVSGNNVTKDEAANLYHSYAAQLEKRGNRDKSIEYLIKAISIRDLSRDVNPEPLKKSLFNLGLCYRKRGDYFKAIEIVERLTLVLPKGRLTYMGYLELIRLFQKTGDYEKSISYFRKAEEYYLSKGDNKSLHQCYVRVALVYRAMDNKSESKAIAFLKKADSLNTHINVSLNFQAIVNLNLGNAYVANKDPLKAEFYYKKSIEQKKKLNDSTSLARLHNNLGSLYIKSARMEEAKINLDSGLKYLKTKDNNRLRSFFYDNYGEYYKSIGDSKSAIENYHKAINLLVRGNAGIIYYDLKEVELQNQPNKLLLFDYIQHKADCWQKVYETTNDKKALENALTDYHLADKLIDIIRFDATEKVSKLFWREKSASLYLKAVKVCYDLDRVADAYYFMEKNKALLLLENLSDQQAKTMSGLPQQLIEQEMRFKQEILSAEKSGDQNTLFDIKRSYERFRDSIETQYPTYSALRKEIPILSYEDHRKTFANDETATIQYIIGTEEGFVLVSSKEKGSLHHIKDVALLNKDIRETMPFFRNPLATEDCLKAYIEKTHSIFKRVFPEGCYERLKGKKLIVAADHSLQNIPFEALVTKEDATFSVNKLEYLIQSNAVYYVYSFSYLYTNNEKERQPTKSFIGFAPKDFTSLDLASLNNSIEEVNAINGIFHEDVFLNEKASKDSFLKEFGQYNIVHLATHSGMDDESHPWLAFRDSKVSLNEIYTTQNNAELVVLSACKTSQGEMVSGEGVMSLARGFFFSGTNTVLSSLWSVNDGSTEKLMVKFYAYLNQGYTKSAALHQAKLDYLNDNEGSMASPFFWSSFILIGNSNAVPIKNPSILMENSYIILIILIGLLLFFYWRKKKK